MNKTKIDEKGFGGNGMELKQKHLPCGEKDNGCLYKIGVFAAMNHVTVKTLRFYEEQGLLLPAHIDPESGYRYYALSQIAVIHQITALKMAGFTLEEIGRIRAGADETGVLLKKKSQLVAQIADLTKQISILDGYLAKQKIGLSAPVLVKTIPAVTVAAMKAQIESYDSLFELMPRMGGVMESLGCQCAQPEYCFTNYLDPDCGDGEIPVELCQSVTMAKKEKDGLYFRTMPEVQAACIFHRGSYSTLGESYEVVLKYMEDNGYEIAGEIRESYIDGVWNQDDERMWLTEIQIPVGKKAE